MKTYLWLAWMLTALLLTGCGGKEAEVPSPTVAPPAVQETIAAQIRPPETIAPQQEAEALALPPPAAVIPEAEAAGQLCESNDRAVVDYSHTEDGYVMVCFAEETELRLKVLVRGPETTYQYNLTPLEWSVFPLSDGNGAYRIDVYENVTGTKYAKVLSAQMDVTLHDEFAPFLRPNQYVNYTAATNAVAMGLELTADREEPLQKVEAVYDYVVGNLTYDYEKAATVQSGYIPQLDEVLEQKKGICFDYAALMTAMLRSQQIPCKMVIGYAGTTYHAWISVWTEESGWVDGAIFFDGHQWKRLDPTFAASGGEEILDFIQNGSYQVKYLY